MRFLLIPALILSSVALGERNTEISSRLTSPQPGEKPSAALGVSYKTEMWTLGVSVGAKGVKNDSDETIYRPDMRLTAGLELFNVGLISMRQRIGYGRQSLIDRQFEGYFVQNLGLAATLAGLVVEVGAESRLALASKNRSVADGFGSYGSVGYRF